MESHPGHLDETISGVVMTVSRAVIEVEEVTNPQADFGSDPRGQPLKGDGVQSGNVG